MSILALDIGSSRIKALLADRDGRLLEARGAPTPRQSRAPGESAYPAEAVYTIIEELVGGIAGRSPRDRVDTLVFSSLGTAMVPLDGRGRPLAAALAPSDTRPSCGARVFEALGLDGAALRERTGSDPASPSFLAHALWWRREHPEVLARTQRWRSLRGYALQRLCGADAEDPSWASRSMLFDLATSTWSADIVAAAGMSPDLLPAIAPSTACYPLRAGPIRRLGLADGAVAVLGAMDNCCSYFGAIGPDRSALVNIVGTYEHMAGVAAPEAARTVARQADALVHCYLLPGHYISLSRVPLGDLLAQLTDGDPASLAALLDGVDEDAPPAPLDRHVTLDGASVRAAIDAGVPRERVLRSLLLAATAVLRRFADAWAARGMPSSPVTVVGGGGGHAAVLRLKTRQLGRSLVTLANDEAAGIGALRLAAISVAGLDPDAACALYPNPVVATFHPAATDARTTWDRGR